MNEMESYTFEEAIKEKGANIDLEAYREEIRVLI